MAKDDTELKTLVLNPKDKSKSSVVPKETIKNTTKKRTSETTEISLTQDLQFTIQIFD